MTVLGLGSSLLVIIIIIIISLYTLGICYIATKKMIVASYVVCMAVCHKIITSNTSVRSRPQPIMLNFYLLCSIFTYYAFEQCSKK